MEFVIKLKCYFEVIVMIFVFLLIVFFFIVWDLIIIYLYNVFDFFVIKKVKDVLFLKKIKFFFMLLIKYVCYWSKVFKK